MRTKRTLGIALMATFAFSACSSGATPSPSASASASVAPSNLLRRAPRPNPQIQKPSSRASRTAPRSTSGRSTSRPRSTSTSRTPSPVSRRRTPASRSTGRTTRRRSWTTPQRLRRRQRAGRHQPLGLRGLGPDTREGPPAAHDRQPAGRTSRTTTSRISSTSSWSTARASSSRGTRASRPSSSTRRSTRRRPEARRLPEDLRRPAGRLPDHQGQDRQGLRHPADGQRPARPDGLRGWRQGHQR